MPLLIEACKKKRSSMVLICTHCRMGCSTKQPLASKMLLVTVSAAQWWEVGSVVLEGALRDYLFRHG